MRIKNILPIIPLVTTTGFGELDIQLTLTISLGPPSIPGYLIVRIGKYSIADGEMPWHSMSFVYGVSRLVIAIRYSATPLWPDTSVLQPSSLLA